MSPPPAAAVDVRSPMAARENPSSAAESRPSSGFDYGGVFPGFGGGNEGVLRRSEPSAATGKPRPRLVKVRKQLGFQNPRSRGGAGAGATGSGYNPFVFAAREKEQSAADVFVFGASDPSGVRVGDSEFVFAAREKCLKPDLFVEKEESLDSLNDSERGNSRSEAPEKTEAELFVFEASDPSGVRVGDSEFVFAARENYQKPDSSVEKEESLANSNDSEQGNSRSEATGKTEAEVFVFGASEHSTTKKESVASAAESGVFVFGATDQNGLFSNSKSSNFCSETGVKKSSCSGFVFGSSWFNLEKSESSENIGTGFRKGEDSGATQSEFLRSSDEDANCFDEAKLNGESVRNLSKVAEVYNLDPEIDLRLNNTCDSNDNNTSVSGSGSAFKLPDQMMKLNIDDTEETGISGTKLPHRFRKINKPTRHRNVDKASNKVSDCSNTSKETEFCDQRSKAHTFVAEEVNSNAFGSGKQNGIPCTSGAEGFAFQAELGEANKVDQSDKGRGVDYTEPNIASFSSNYPNESVHFVEEKNHTKSSLMTPDRFGPSSMDSGIPLCDPSSLKDSLFTTLNKKLDVKIRSMRDKRLKDSRRKLKKPSVKECNDLDKNSKESSLQEDANSNGCYSPMDFSPYQESTVADQYPKETPNNGIPSIPVFGNGACMTPVDSSDVKSQQDTITQFLFTSGLDNKTDSSAVKGEASARRHRYRRRSRLGAGDETFVITPSANVEPKAVPLCQNAVDKSNTGSNFNQRHSSSPEVHVTCETWRVRGNEAYKNGDLSKAEELYTHGIRAVPFSERSGNSLEPLLLCYSNRAAARMRLYRVREAIGDCTMAVALDPNFLKVQMRAGNCHLLLGEIEHALQYYSKCLEAAGAGVCLDRRIILDAADGQQKAQKVAECIDQSTKLLEERNPDAALRSLEIISQALSVSSYSEKLLKLKADALIMLRRHEEVVQLCEQSVSFAEKNFVSESASGNHSFVRLWRWFLMGKSFFLLGKLEAALPLLDKLTQVGYVSDESARKDIESAASLAATIRRLLDTKNAGNEAFKSRRYSEAVDHYTVALSSNVGSRHFAAICFCNRAAAHQALGQIADAIADCSLAIALDGNYTKAVSRRATLHEMIRDYGQAANDLQRLVSVLESQPLNKSKQSGSSGRSAGSAKELKQAQMRLPVMEREAKSGVSLDFYLILGNKSSDSSADIKKAYRKAALKHHPDKAGQFLARSDCVDEGLLWKDISEEVHKDADRLFKMIGEAYTVLSDSSKRLEYDLEDEVRKSSKVNNGSTGQRSQPDCQYTYSSNSNRRSDFGSSNKQKFRDNWKTYGDSFSRW